MRITISSHSLNLNALRHTKTAGAQLANSMQKLTSGYRINAAADAPADLVQSEKLRSQTAGLERAIENVSEAYNMVAVAEGAMGQIGDILRHLKELALHAANSGVINPAQVAADQAEMDAGLQAIDRIANTTAYGEQKLLNDGTRPHIDIVLPFLEWKEVEAAPDADAADAESQLKPVSYWGGRRMEAVYGPPVARLKQSGDAEGTERTVQAGDSTEAHDRITFTFAAMTLSSLGQVHKLDADDSESPGRVYTLEDCLGGGAAGLAADPVLALEIVDQAIQDVALERARQGAFQSTVLQSTLNNLSVMLENTVRSESALRDTDFATETVRYTQSLITQEVGTTLVAQANQLQARTVLNLLDLNR